MITLAVLADIHSNSIALQAVLDNLDAQGEADHTLVLGELVVFGPDPMGVLTLLQKHGLVFMSLGIPTGIWLKNRLLLPLGSKVGKLKC
jgi:hypothetical protein